MGQSYGLQKAHLYFNNKYCDLKKGAFTILPVNFELCPLNLFQIISSILVLAVLILLVRYAWGIFFDTNYRPVEWEKSRKQGLISKELIRMERNYPDKVRFFNWWFQVERLKKDGVPGDFAELGVYKGESAKIIHALDSSRKFHLYDTFEGFNDEDLRHETGEAATYTTRNFADTSLGSAKIPEDDKLCSIPGVSESTVDIVVADTTLNPLPSREGTWGGGTNASTSTSISMPTKRLGSCLFSPGG
jgi:hypothetical protein